MRVGIIGGGAAGLASAWLLEQEHEVTLFEKDERFGGHAHTVTIEAHGQRLDVDAGFQFFAPGAAYATFNRLLDILHVPRRSYPATLTVYHSEEQRPVVMPPLRGGLPVWSSFTPRALRTLIRFRRFLADVPAFLAQHDRTLTIGEYLERRRLPREFVDGFLLPLLLAFWCVEASDFQRFTAYNALYYLGANMPTGVRAPDQSEIEGGLKVYVDALVSSLDRTQLRRDSAVQQRHPRSGRLDRRGRSAAAATPSTTWSSRRTRARRCTCSIRPPRRTSCASSCAASSTSTPPSRSTGIGG